jgi:hypothetical protein
VNNFVNIIGENDMKKLILFALIAFSLSASAALYNVVGTDIFVNGIPTGLSTKERAKLVTTTVAKTEASCLASKCDLVGQLYAKNKIKAIILAETPPPVPVCLAPQVLNTATNKCETPAPPHTCPAGQTGTPPNCVTPPPPVCPSGTTGTPPNCTPIVVPPVSLMPVVDTSKNMTPLIGVSTQWIENKGDFGTAGDGNGQFRIVCVPSHMSNDDPIVYPGQQGAAHHHTFFGNTSVNFATDPMKMADVGNSVCQGGTANRSAYWIPSLIDTETNAPIKPNESVWYYKTQYIVPKTMITVPPKGLRFIAGDMKSKVKQADYIVDFKCHDKGNTREWGQGQTIPACGAGNVLSMGIYAPQCWDGKNLDSPGHREHMAYADWKYSTPNKCPTTHPVPIPKLSLNIYWNIDTNAKVRLSSDNYAYDGNNAGHSAHADWINGWQTDIMTLIVTKCLNAGRDCHVGVLGDGRNLQRLPWPVK